MTIEELNKIAEQECSWLKYYGNREQVQTDDFNDAIFYDRISAIDSGKRLMPLHLRCCNGSVTAKSKLVLDCSVEELELKMTYRKHSENVFSALEYILATNSGNHQKFREILKAV